MASQTTDREHNLNIAISDAKSLGLPGAACQAFGVVVNCIQGQHQATHYGVRKVVADNKLLFDAQTILYTLKIFYVVPISRGPLWSPKTTAVAVALYNRTR